MRRSRGSVREKAGSGCNLDLVESPLAGNPRHWVEASEFSNGESSLVAITRELSFLVLHVREFLPRWIHDCRSNELVTGTREEFDAWIRNTIGSDFRWRVRPRDTPSNREMIASLVLDELKRNDGIFPQSNVFIERIGDTQEDLR